jgi:dUTP pyrophosphatase
MILSIQLLDSKLEMPRYALPGCSGFDLCSALHEDTLLQPQRQILVPTGIKMEIPEGYEGQIRPRSGLALRHGITVLNSPGTVDASYRGEIQVLLMHFGTEPVTLSFGMRIAQMVIAPVVFCTLTPVMSLAPSQRQEKGWGSTGI